MRGYFPPFLQLLGIVEGVDLQPRQIPLGEVGGHRGVDPPAPGADLGGRNGCSWLGMGSLGVHPEDGVEDLHGGVGVQGSHDLGDVGEVAVDKLTQTPVILHRPQAARTTHKQLKARNAEGILHIDEQQAYPHLVGFCRWDAVLLGPLLRL